MKIIRYREYRLSEIKKNINERNNKQFIEQFFKQFIKFGQR